MPMNDLLRLASKVEQRLDTAGRCVEHSVVAMLAKAFYGELTLGSGNNHGFV